MGLEKVCLFFVFFGNALELGEHTKMLISILTPLRPKLDYGLLICKPSSNISLTNKEHTFFDGELKQNSRVEHESPRR